MYYYYNTLYINKFINGSWSWHITAPSHGYSYPLRRWFGSWFVETLIFKPGFKHVCNSPFLLTQGRSLHVRYITFISIHHEWIFTCTAWLVSWRLSNTYLNSCGKKSWIFNWSIFSWIQSYTCTSVVNASAEWPSTTCPLTRSVWTW